MSDERYLQQLWQLITCKRAPSSENTDWDGLSALALRECVLSQFVTALRGRKEIHDMAKALWRKLCYLQDYLEYYQALQRKAIVEMVSILENLDISHIMLKGLVLQEKYYQSSIREGRDIDFLIAEDRLEELNQTLDDLNILVGESYDFEKKHPIALSSARREKIIKRLYSHEDLTRYWPTGDPLIAHIPLDIQFKMPVCDIGCEAQLLADIFVSRKRMQLGDVQIYTFDEQVEYLYMLLSLNGDMHFEEKIQQQDTLTLRKLLDLRLIKSALRDISRVEDYLGKYPKLRQTEQFAQQRMGQLEATQ